ncbi:hypothetical protein ACE6H2_007338 [Prunus campanulata]
MSGSLVCHFSVATKQSGLASSSHSSTIPTQSGVQVSSCSLALQLFDAMPSSCGLFQGGCVNSFARFLFSVKL